MFFKILKNIFDTFGAPVFIPIVIFVIALIMKVDRKKAFFSALFAGVGLEGFMLLLNSFTPIITPVVKNMVESTGIKLPVFDAGWQAAALVAYASQAGMVYLGVGLILQILLFAVRWTDVFQPGDLWNNYSYMLWGSMVYLVTRNMFLALLCMVVLNLYSLLITELIAKRWSNYYKYPNCTIVAMHNIEPAIFAIGMNWLLNKLGLNKIKLSPEELQKKMGFLGEPVSLGLILGLLIGIAGNYRNLGHLSAWGQISTTAIATSAIMAIFPRIAGIFAQAFLPLTEAARKTAQNVGAKSREWYLGINDAVGYGEPATLISGIVLIPIMIILAVILPGNKVLPVVDLVALPFMVEGIVAIVNGNIFKIVLIGAIWFSTGLYMGSFTAPLFTQIASQVGVNLPVGALLITSFNLLAKPIVGLIFLAFLSQKWYLIVLTIVIYFMCYFAFKKNKTAIYEYLENSVIND
ncbi:PTS galactitol transporter subunit IIC [Thermoanaerobacterium sp. DL9XJH110]|uniref:PTS galactitol transporter subunit IIC n=1 Tax=Thermoanaerobacterium sp. DL9XJH110 TaxID=3386643 RepID=UPI003BB73E59